MYRETILVSTLLFNVVLSSLLSGDFEIADGVKLVSISDNSLDDEGRSMGDTPLYRMARFLHNHELHVKLPNLIEKDKLTKIFSESLKAIDESYKEKNGFPQSRCRKLALAPTLTPTLGVGRSVSVFSKESAPTFAIHRMDDLGVGNNVWMDSIHTLMRVDTTSINRIIVTGRGSKGDGGGSLALLGLMFAKTLGAAGIGGLGLLTMKALAVSALALMLSAIVGVKKLTSHDDHDDHQVIYAGHHGSHRRRRDTPLPYQVLPYQGWVEGKKRD